MRQNWYENFGFGQRFPLTITDTDKIISVINANLLVAMNSVCSEMEPIKVTEQKKKVSQVGTGKFKVQACELIYKFSCYFDSSILIESLTCMEFRIIVQ